MRHLILPLALALAACETNGTTSAGDPLPPESRSVSEWPMYGHDPARTCYNPAETSIAAANVSRLTPRFQAAVGMGAVPSSSGPIVAGGRVCIGSSVTQGANYFCFDATSGAQEWSADLGRLPEERADVGIGSTAVVAGNVLIVGGGDAAYYAVEPGTGAILWKHDMNVGPDPFAWSSPLIANGLVYVGISSQYEAVEGELRALHVADGTIAARQTFVPTGHQGADIWNSAALSPDGSRVVVATGNDYGGYEGPYGRAMIALDPASLAIVEFRQEAVPNQDLDFGTTPVFFSDAAGRVLVGANNKNGTFYAYALGRFADGPVWRRSTGLSAGAMPAYDPATGAGGTLFIVGDNGLLFGVDPSTGADRWPPVAVGFVAGNVALANGLVFVNVGGTLVIVSADAGRILRILQPATVGPTYTGPAVANGMVYWMAGGILNAWGLP